MSYQRIIEILNDSEESAKVVRGIIEESIEDAKFHALGIDYDPYSFFKDKLLRMVGLLIYKEANERYPAFFRNLFKNEVSSYNTVNIMDGPRNFTDHMTACYYHALFCVAGQRFIHNFIWDEKDGLFAEFFKEYSCKSIGLVRFNFEWFSKIFYGLRREDCYRALEGIYCDVVLDKVKESLR